MSSSATVEAQITVHSALSFLWGKFALFPCCSASWVSRGYLDFGVIFDFLDAWVSVTAPISPRGTLSSSGVSSGSSKDLPVAVEFPDLFNQTVQGGGLWGKHQEFRL